MKPAQTLRHYNELLRLAEQQAELVERGELEGLGPLSNRFEELASSLPSRPPAAAAALLQRASTIGQRAEAKLSSMQQALMQDVAVAAKASRAAHGYALRPPRGRRIDHCA